MNHRSEKAFTLIELLVSTAVFALILVVLMSLTTGTAMVTNSSQAHMESGAGLRESLDCLSADFRTAVLREDLPPLFQKATGNDAMYFFAAADGYDGPRGISIVGYRVRNERLERGAQGAGWATNALPFAKDLASSDFVTSPANLNYDVLGERVFRMETEFLLKDGTLLTSTPPTKWEDVEAVVINLATIDQRALKKARGSLTQLAELFPDSQNSTTTIKTWADKLMDAEFMQGDENFPAEARRGIHVRQRTIPIAN